ncbi:MAG TPA: DUF5700 domain-containing putative Zn-dependent protease, partial [Thermoanaerobaculia bacterium]|nr:DUF5700 domain-containing putative Zn-dependent protease [Thermoanaerobaculia bacterium]
MLRLLVFLLALPVLAQNVDVDISACRGMYGVLKAMRDGKSRDVVTRRLDAVLDTRAYQLMFKHYNRSWRPNHLPRDVFRRMILSLRFDDTYHAGENERADAMRPHWKSYYDNLPSYAKKLRQLERANMKKIVRDGVRYAQTWLPPGWTIPSSYLAVMPHGGSSAFAIDGMQGYDFLQLPDDLPSLAGTIAHESHHLGIALEAPPSLNEREKLAFRILALMVPEGTATKFVSGPPAGCTPALAEVPYHIYTKELEAAWNARVAEEPEMLKHLHASLESALTG